jgi:hypothetical protein
LIIVYSLALFRAGAKNGPDVGLWGGWKKFKLPSEFLKEGLNTLIVIIESFGLNRQPFTTNDIRNPRGILAAHIRGAKIVRWNISGLDVRQMDDVFNSSGFTDEALPMNNVTTEVWSDKLIIPVGLPVWNRVSFTIPDPHPEIFSPLRLCFSGCSTCYAFINGTLIARYYGNGDTPQSSFYIPDGLLEIDNELKLISYTWDPLSDIGIEIKPWNIGDGLGSGNLNENGNSFKLFQRRMKFN